MFTSQSKLIEQHAEHFFPSPGFFLEIGAWDGELISQTAYLEREQGWTGVCVDPFPLNFKDRTCRVCARAISADGRPRLFIKVSIDRRYGGDVSYFSGFADKIAAHWPLIQEHCNYEQMEVETITFAQLAHAYNLPRYIEFLSVDTEGSEMEIFDSIDFDRYSFGLIMFEHNESEEIKSYIGRLLVRHGYHLLATTRIDDIYAGATP